MQRILVRVKSTAPTKRERAMARPYSQKLIQTFIIMKKFIFSLAALCMGMCAMAQSNVYAYQKDGETLELEVSNLDSISFTKPTKATQNGYTWVELGLPSGLRWAAYNIGAKKPEEYGNYYAWGEIATKTTYDWSTYKYADGSFSTLTKYCNGSNYGKDSFTDELTTLTAADDAATQSWGGNWRMPTIDEWQELIDNCDCNWTTDYNNTGVAGCVLTSKINGSSIFLPAAGYYDEGTLESVGAYGGYWSSTLYTSYPNDAKGTSAHSGGINTNGSFGRYYGRTIRPVLCK